MKNIICHIIVVFSLIGCTSTLKDNPITFTSELSKCEKSAIEYEKEFRRFIDNNWKQEKLFKHEDLSCCYCIYLNEDKIVSIPFRTKMKEVQSYQSILMISLTILFYN